MRYWLQSGVATCGRLLRLVRLLCLLLLLPGGIAAADPLAQAAELLREGQPEEALRIYQEAAELGDPLAAFGAGVLYFTGLGTEKDLAASTRWFRVAAEKDYAPAQFNLGNAYLHGRGVSKDPVQAEVWWRKSATQGYPPAQFNLGSLLYNNADSAERREEGIAWLRAAAEQEFDMAAKKLVEIGEPAGLPAHDTDSTDQPQRDEAKLLNLDPRGYTIQIFSGVRPESAERLLRSNGLKGRALRFRFQGKKGLWTGLVYGWYPTRAQAAADLQDLAPEIRAAGPWIRTVESVQASIRQVR
jgi:hypothetical protein